MTIVEFLLARYDDADGLIDEYEEWMAARAAEAGTYSVVVPPGWAAGEPFNVDHKRADIAAKRLLLAEHQVMYPDTEYAYCGRCYDYEDHDAMFWPCTTVKIMALPFATHADYDPAWAPS